MKASLLCCLALSVLASATIFYESVTKEYRVDDNLFVRNETSTFTLDVRSDAHFAGNVVIEGDLTTSGSTGGGEGSNTRIQAPLSSMSSPATPGGVFSMIEGEIYPGAVYGRTDRSKVEVGSGDGSTSKIVELDDDLAILLYTTGSLEIMAVPVRIVKNEIVWKGWEMQIATTLGSFEWTACRADGYNFVVFYGDDSGIFGKPCRLMAGEIVGYSAQLIEPIPSVWGMSASAIDDWAGSAEVVLAVGSDSLGKLYSLSLVDYEVNVRANYTFFDQSVDIYKDGFSIMESFETDGTDERPFGIAFTSYSTLYVVLGRINPPSVTLGTPVSMNDNLNISVPCDYCSASRGHDYNNQLSTLTIGYMDDDTDSSYVVIANANFTDLTVSFGPVNMIITPYTHLHVSRAGNLDFTVTYDDDYQYIMYCKVNSSDFTVGCFPPNSMEVSPVWYPSIHGMTGGSLLVLLPFSQVEVFVTSTILVAYGHGGTQSSSLIGVSTGSANPGESCELETCGVVALGGLEIGKKYYASHWSGLSTEPDKHFRHEVGIADTANSLFVFCP